MTIYGIWADGGYKFESSFVEDCFFLKREDAEAELAQHFPQVPSAWFTWSVREIKVR